MLMQKETMMKKKWNELKMMKKMEQKRYPKMKKMETAGAAQ